MWDEITHPFPSLNGATVEVWKWISNFTPHFTGHVITYPCGDQSQSMLVKAVSDIIAHSHLTKTKPNKPQTMQIFLGIGHDDVIKWKHFPRYWPFVQGIHRSPLNSPDKGQWRGALMFSLICAWTNGWLNNRDAGDLRCHRAHYDVTMMM